MPRPCHRKWRDALDRDARGEVRRAPREAHGYPGPIRATKLFRGRIGRRNQRVGGRNCGDVTTGDGKPNITYAVVGTGRARNDPPRKPHFASVSRDALSNPPIDAMPRVSVMPPASFSATS